MSFILSIIFYWIQQGKLAILILSIKKNIPSGPYYLVMLPTMHRDELDELFSVRGLGPEAFTGMALYPASAWKIPYSARLCLHTFLAFPPLSFLASHNLHLAQGSSFSCITAPVAVHTAVSLYSWSHANINAGFLTTQKQQVLSSRLHWHLNFLLLIADGLMASWPIII